MPLARLRQARPRVLKMFADWTDRIRAVTAEQVQGAAKQWLEKQRSVTGYLIKDKSPQVEKRS